MIQSPQLEFIMEAHNGLSAKIVEEAGFKAIWGSGLSISASLGVRDNNEASWTQVLDVLEFMSDATSIPILLDGDTGYGNFNNMRRLVTKLEQRNIGGVCIEDKLFPKTNSFINGESQPLADIEEFCGKIKAAKDAQLNDDFVVVARIEAFIAGWGLEEALKRADAYRIAGADAILVHSKKANCSDIDAFMQEWGNRHPVIIVPTKYYSTPTDHFRDIGISSVIWANHNVRSAITAMKHTTKTIFENESLVNVEGRVATVSDIFALQGADELKEAEKLYLPGTAKNMNSILLAASRGENIDELTEELPKSLLKVNGKPLLNTQIEYFNQEGIKDVQVVCGYKHEHIQEVNIAKIINEEYANTYEVYSLMKAVHHIKQHTVISYGDILYKSYILHELLNDDGDITLVVDASADPEEAEGYRDYVTATKPYMKKWLDNRAEFIKMGNKAALQSINGEFIGLWKVNEAGAKVLKTTLSRLSQSDAIKTMRMSELINELVKQTKVSVLYINGAWLDVDDLVSYQKAGDLFDN